MNVGFDDVVVGEIVLHVPVVLELSVQLIEISFLLVGFSQQILGLLLCLQKQVRPSRPLPELLELVEFIKNFQYLHGVHYPHSLHSLSVV